MEELTFVKLMVEYKEAQLLADELRARIVDEVMAREKTQSIGGVKASYSGGRKSYDYEAAARDCPMVSSATIDLFTVKTERVDWREICKHAGVEDVPFTQSAPSVSIKIE